METRSKPFFAWDLLTVVQLVRPELFTTSEVECDIVVEGPSQGRVMRTAAGTAAVVVPVLSPFRTVAQSNHSSVCFVVFTIVCLFRVVCFSLTLLRGTMVAALLNTEASGERGGGVAIRQSSPTPEPEVIVLFCLVLKGAHRRILFSQCFPQSPVLPRQEVRAYVLILLEGVAERTQ